MIPRELATIVLALTAAGVFLYARSISSIAVVESEAAVPPSATLDPQAAQKTPTVAAPEAKPVSAPTIVAPTPIAKPTPVAKPTPQPKPPVVPPRPARASNAKNPDDAPSRTVSGKVQRSTDKSLSPAFGPLDAKVQVTVISDFQCPVCRRAVDATHQIAEEWPSEIRVSFHHHPLKMHRNAEDAAAAALAAQMQGKFWEYHDMLFQNQRALDRLSLNAYAERLGLNMDQFKKDMDNAEYRARIQDKHTLAKDLGARGTPAFLINGKLSVGWGSWNGFRGQVLRELQQVRTLVGQGKDVKSVIVDRAKTNSKDPAAFALYRDGILKPLGIAP